MAGASADEGEGHHAVWCGEFGSESGPAPKPVLGQADAHSVRVSSRRHILLAALLGCVWGAAMAIAANSYSKSSAAEPMPLHGWDGARALLECALRSLDEARPWTRLLAPAPESPAPQLAPTASWQRIVAMLGSLQTQLNHEITPLDNRTRITAGAWRLRRTHRQAAPAARSQRGGSGGGGGWRRFSSRSRRSSSSRACSRFNAVPRSRRRSHVSLG